MATDTYKPDWAPDNNEDGFACNVMRGVVGGHDGSLSAVNRPLAPHRIIKKKKLSVQDYVEGIKAGDRTILARAITLIESNAKAHFDMAQQVIQAVLPLTGKSVRVGITGVPGAGKSTFIEAFGNMLCDKGYKVAVLAVDPSSSVTKGSILGDKTRMETLTKNPSAFIRPSPAGGTLGGVNRKSRETLLLCEAAGYDVILVETVGVGQSETTVRSMVDFFLLLVLTGAGDELQGIKKGVMELADAITINKADGENAKRALVAEGDYERMLHYIRPATEGWKTHAYRCSALTKKGLPEIWDVIQNFVEQTKASGVFMQRRQNQTLTWVNSMIEEHLKTLFFQNTVVQGRMGEVQDYVLRGKLSPSQAVEELLTVFEETTFNRKAKIFEE